MHHSHIASKSRFSWPRLLDARKGFSAEEVRELLQVDGSRDPRAAAVHAVAARTSVWSGRLPNQTAFELGRAAPRLPSVVYWYCQGMSAADIGRRISPFGGAWDANHALDAAASLIADALNRSDPADVAA